MVTAAEHLGRRGPVCATTLGAPGPPAVLAGSLLPEDTGQGVVFQALVVPEADVDRLLEVTHTPSVQLGPHNIVIEQG